MLRGDERRTRLAYSLQFTMPGTPVLRYGGEIGMGRTSLRGRDAAHRCSGTTAAAAVLPGNQAEFVRGHPARGGFGVRKVERARPRSDPESLLSWFSE
jgi:maltose alpha-D-glucosyltransferase/alpha-amylase